MEKRACRAKRVIQKDANYWLTYEKPIPKLSKDKLRYRCNVEGCYPDKKRGWANIHRHLQTHGKPKEDRQLGNPTWECPLCKDCDCCNGGPGKSYKCMEKNQWRHWWKNKEGGSKRCKHPPERKRPLPAPDSWSDDDPVITEEDEVEDTPKTHQARRREDGREASTSAIALYRNLYWTNLQRAHEATLQQLRQVCDYWSSKGESLQGPPISQNSHTVAQDFEHSVLVKPLLLEEYLGLQRQGANPDAEPGFLFLSAEQAREYFASGRPRLPVIVPGELDRDARPLIKRKDVLAKIRAFATVNAHDHLAKVADDLYATEMDTGLVVDSFEKKRGTLNLLDMAIAVPNTTPSFLVNLPGWDLMPYIGSTNELKQPHQHDHRDMSASVNFQLFANLHATSTKHCDRGGVVTTVRAEFGDKMWLTWPSQSVQQLRSFGWSGKPAGIPFPIYIAAGYTLVQPAGTVHEVYTGPLCSDSYMVGTMHTPSQNLDRQAECMEVEAWAVNMTTNEDPAYEAAAKMDAWLEMMKAGNDAFPWPSAEQRAVFEQSFNVSDVSMHATTTLTLVT